MRHSSFHYGLQEMVYHLPRKRILGTNWERVAVFSGDILNVQVQNNTSVQNQD